MVRMLGLIPTLTALWISNMAFVSVSAGLTIRTAMLTKLALSLTYYYHYDCYYYYHYHYHDYYH